MKKPFLSSGENIPGMVLRSCLRGLENQTPYETQQSRNAQGSRGMCGLSSSILCPRNAGQACRGKVGSGEEWEVARAGHGMDERQVPGTLRKSGSQFPHV